MKRRTLPQRPKHSSTKTLRFPAPGVLTTEGFFAWAGTSLLDAQRTLPSPKNTTALASVVFCRGRSFCLSAFRIFYIFSARGGGRGSPRHQEGGGEPLLKIPGGGGFQEGKGREVVWSELGNLGGGSKYFFRGRNIHQVLFIRTVFFCSFSLGKQTCRRSLRSVSYPHTEFYCPYRIDSLYYFLVRKGPSRRFWMCTQVVADFQEKSRFWSLLSDDCHTILVRRLAC